MSAQDPWTRDPTESVALRKGEVAQYNADVEAAFTILDVRIIRTPVQTPQSPACSVVVRDQCERAVADDPLGVGARVAEVASRSSSTSSSRSAA